jgi:hypothetical protein
MAEPNTGTASTPRADERPLKILAKSVYRELKASGYSRSDMVGFTNALLDLVTSDMKTGDEDDAS